MKQRLEIKLRHSLVKDRKIQGVIVGMKRDKQIKDLVDRIMGPGVGAIDLVNYYDRLEFIFKGLGQDKPCLRHRAFKSIHNQKNPVGHFQHPLHLAAKICMARRINDVDFIIGTFRIGINNRTVFTEDGNSPLPFQGVGVHNQTMLPAGQFIQFAVAKHAGLVKQLIDQGGFPMIDMSDYRYITYIFNCRQIIDL